MISSVELLTPTTIEFREPKITHPPMKGCLSTRLDPLKPEFARMQRNMDAMMETRKSTSINGRDAANIQQIFHQS